MRKTNISWQILHTKPVIKKTEYCGLQGVVVDQIITF